MINKRIFVLRNGGAIVRSIRYAAIITFLYPLVFGFLCIVIPEWLAVVAMILTVYITLYDWHRREWAIFMQERLEGKD